MQLQELVARNLRLHRLRIGLTQQQLADRLAVYGDSLNVKKISQFESRGGNFTLQTIEKLATGLGVKPYELLLEPLETKDFVSMGIGRSQKVVIEAAIKMLQSLLEEDTSKSD